MLLHAVGFDPMLDDGDFNEAHSSVPPMQKGLALTLISGLRRRRQWIAAKVRSTSKYGSGPGGRVFTFDASPINDNPLMGQVLMGQVGASNA